MIADVHSHLLCGMDDGARTPEESRKGLCYLSAIGVRYLAFTPHFYPAQTSISRFLSHREKAAAEIAAFPELKNFSVNFGAEVYLTEALFNHEKIERLCYSGTDLLLTELDFSEHFNRSQEKRLDRLVANYSVTPVLAHIDRYPFIMRDGGVRRFLRDMGCLFQFNPSVKLGFFETRHFYKLLEEGGVDCLGLDLHRAFPPERIAKENTEKWNRRVPGSVREDPERFFPPKKEE